jgi:polyribonucleotide nucleotidyltransferase
MQTKVDMDFCGRPLSIELGKVAKQADGAALVQFGETVVLATAVAAMEAREEADFFPLTVDYQEKAFAAGRVPGGFFKREGRPTEKEILSCRLIDRSIRPLFRGGFHSETQIIATVLSADRENDPDMVAMLATSVALEVSDIPFGGPLAGIRVGRLNGQWVMNPTQSELADCDVNIFLSGTRDGIVMVEGGANIVSEEGILEALYNGHEAIQPLIDVQEKLKRQLGKPKRSIAEVTKDEKLEQRVRELAEEKIRGAVVLSDKKERNGRVEEVSHETLAQLSEEAPGRENEIRATLKDLEKEQVRALVVGTGKRIDGRSLTDIRPITCEVNVLPRAHGSAIFTRGETQALVVATLGTAADEQKIDSLNGEQYKKFMLHYNFPPFSVGEVRFMRGPGRREIGHGALAERALAPVLPSPEQFPYTLRVVSEILESNGSTSMASVCGGTLSLMDAGVPIKASVAGIAMGLIKEGDEVRVLSDILGDEDHLGDMDFKVAGTREGITALQMDIKISRVTREIMRDALFQAREGRLHILGIMNETLATARTEVSGHAPRITTIKVKPDKIRDIIGPGGKVIRGIVEETGAKIDVEDDGTVTIASNDEAGAQRAVDMIKGLVAEVEVGAVYKGVVRRIMDFGAFVEILPGTDGLVHISQLAHEHVRRVRDVVNEGDEVMVKVLEIDRQGRIRLSRKELLPREGGEQDQPTNKEG